MARFLVVFVLSSAPGVALAAAGRPEEASYALQIANLLVAGYGAAVLKPRIDDHEKRLGVMERRQ
jgi:hypothetical protein